MSATTDYAELMEQTMPAKSLGTLTSISKVKINHPPLPHGTALVYYETGKGFRKHFLLHLLYDISLNHQHCFRGKGAEELTFFRKRNERYEMQCKLLGVPSTFGRHRRLGRRLILPTSVKNSFEN